jgi:hypothetical protein
VRLLGTALVVNLDPTDFRGKGRGGLVSDHCRRIEVDY